MSLPASQGDAAPDAAPSDLAIAVAEYRMQRPRDWARGRSMDLSEAVSYALAEDPGGRI